MDIHLRIKQLVEKRGKSQEELANVLGVTPKTAHNYLNGHTKIEANQIPVIAKFLRVPSSYLFDNDLDLNTILSEPEYNYGKIDCDLCKQKDKTIAALEENIQLLKGQIEYLQFNNGR